jgi:hypothetical protein
MANDFQLLTEIQPQDTLSEGREKLNSIVKRVNEGKFDNIFVRGDINVDGKLFVNEIVSEETQTIRTEQPIFTLYDLATEETAVVNTNDRGIVFKYATTDVGVKFGFFGWSGYGETGALVTKFKFIPDASVDVGGVYNGTRGVIDAKIEASDILNTINIVPSISSGVVTIANEQTVTGPKTFSGLIRLTAANQGNSNITDALTAARTIITTDGILINGTNSANLIENRTLSLDQTVVRADSRNQTILGTKTFSTIVVSDSIIGTSSSVLNGVYTTATDQTIFGSKVFKQGAGRDGIRLFPQNLGTNNRTLTITTAQSLTADRSLTLADANTTLVAGTMVSTTVNQTIDSEKTFTKNLFFSNSLTEKRGIKGTVSGDDFWFVGGKADSIDAGYVEIATGADGQEAIYARQYIGSPLTATPPFRTFVIISTDGHTETPGHVILGAQATATTHAVRADRLVSAGTGLSGGGNLTANRTLSVNFTEVVRTSTNQSISGTKTFTGIIIASDTIIGNSTSASKLATPRNINGIPFDGSQNITISAAVNGIFYESLQLVSTNYVVPTDRNSMAIGPITIGENVQITVSSGSVFTII